MEIEKGVPIPPKGTGSLYKRLADQMVPGDSVLFQSEGQAKGFRTYLSTHGIHAVRRKVAGGWRVWRMEDFKAEYGLRVVA